MRYSFLIVVLILAAVAASAQEPITLTPCQVAGTEPNKKLDVLCGKLEVFEGRHKRSGRKIGTGHIFLLAERKSFAFPSVAL